MIKNNILITDLETLLAAQDSRTTTNADPEKVKEVEEFLDTIEFNPQVPKQAASRDVKVAICGPGVTVSLETMKLIQEMDKTVSLVIVNDTKRSPVRDRRKDVEVLLAEMDIERPMPKEFLLKNYNIEPIQPIVKISQKELEKPWYDPCLNKRRKKKKY